MNDELRAWVESEVGAVKEAARIGAGASREIWRVDTANGAFVVRYDSGSGPVAGTPLDLGREAVVYRALQGHGLPVPLLHAVAPGGHALLLAFVDGQDSLAAVEDPLRRGEIARDYLCCLARLHALDPRELPLPGFRVPATGPQHALVDLALWSSICKERAAGWTASSTPFALSWLEANAPPVPSATALCHGDAGPGNFLFTGRHVTALLDWEFAHVGDPHDDLAWVAVRNHLLGRPMDVSDAFGVWCETTGIAVERSLLEYYRVFVLVRMAISCDATVAWRGGVDDPTIRTQVLLRPWLGLAVTTALDLAGCDDPELRSLRSDAEATLVASPDASLLALIPPLEPLAGP